MSRRKPENQNVQSPTNRDVNAAVRAAMAVQLRAKKTPYEEIARQCGYGSAGAAHKAIQRELRRTISTNVEEMRREELESLERLEEECWKIFNDKNFEKARLFAADRILSIKERRAKLMGLDVPVDVAANANVVVVREVPTGWIAEPVIEAAS